VASKFGKSGGDNNSGTTILVTPINSFQPTTTASEIELRETSRKGSQTESQSPVINPLYAPPPVTPAVTPAVPPAVTSGVGALALVDEEKSATL
jgi:hypothetical protein